VEGDGLWHVLKSKGFGLRSEEARNTESRREPWQRAFHQAGEAPLLYRARDERLITYVDDRTRTAVRHDMARSQGTAQFLAPSTLQATSPSTLRIEFNVDLAGLGMS